MSIQIELHSEVLIKEQWLYYGTGQILRGDDFFKKIVSLSQAKPIPQNISLITKIHHLMSFDGCDEDLIDKDSFLDAYEILQISDWICIKNEGRAFFDNLCFFESRIGYLFNNSWGGFTERKEEYPPELKDIRWIFWLRR